MSPRLSVVIKSYNHDRYVAETIRSVLDQSFQDFEILVTDDGSTDRTVDVVRTFDDPRIDLEVFPSNRGISAAMNSLLGRARGEFIAILNSDDFALPGRFDLQVRHLESHPNIGVVFGVPRHVDDDGAPCAGYSRFQTPDGVISRADWLRHFFFKSNCLCAPTAMVRRSAYACAGPYDLRLANLQDLDMWVRICVDHEIDVLPQELTAFRVRAGQMNMSAPRPDSVCRSLFEFAQILKRYRTMPPELLRQVFAADLAAHGIDAGGPPGIWLAELALTCGHLPHRLFALQSMFDDAAADGEIRRLFEVTGAVDLFQTRVWEAQVPPSPAPAFREGSQSKYMPQLDRPDSRNALCPCGSGKRYKHCHGRLD